MSNTECRADLWNPFSVGTKRQQAAGNNAERSLDKAPQRPRAVLCFAAAPPPSE